MGWVAGGLLGVCVAGWVAARVLGGSGRASPAPTDVGDVGWAGAWAGGSAPSGSGVAGKRWS